MPLHMMRTPSPLKLITQPLVTPSMIYPPFTLARAQASGAMSTVLGPDGATRSEAAADVPRYNGTGSRLLIEGQRTNLFANARALSSGSVGVSAGSHTISFFGTGSVTLSGAATATINGTGADNRVSQTVTASAGTLTFTVSGSVTWAQLEQAPFASSPVLPPVGTPGASTRGADLVMATLASLGVGANGACTVVGTAMFPQAAPAATDQTLLQIDAGADTNRYRVRMLPGSLDINAGGTNAGSPINATTLGAVTAGVVFRFGVSVDGSGRIAASLNGAAAQTAAGLPTSGLTTIRVGNNAAAKGAMFGEVGTVRVLPFAVSDAELQRLVTEQTP